MIRPFKKEDLHSLIEIFKLNVPEYFNINELKDFENYLLKHGDTYLTIERDNLIVGGAGYKVNEGNNTGQITWIFFHPQHTGKGLGKEAILYGKNILESIPKMEKIVVTTSQQAYKFFEKFGFVNIKITSNFWGPGLDLYLMEQHVK